MSGQTRREWLRTVALGGAVASGSVPLADANTPGWPMRVAAAKTEGKVVINTFPGDGYKRALKAFTVAYPDIKLEHTSLHSQDFAPRILQERKGAKLFQVDAEENLPEVVKTQDIAKAVIK